MKQLKPYPKYKPSGVEWLGDVPEHWRVVQFKRLASIQNGRDYKHIVADDGAYPVIGSGGVFAKASDYLFKGESVLLGRKGTIDKPLYIRGAFWPVDTMFYTEIDSKSNARFVYYCALTIPFDRYSTNTALPSMTQEDLSSNRITAPAYREQSAITAFLDHEMGRIDALVEKKNRFIELLKEKRQALITDAGTGKFDVSTGKPYPAYKSSGVEWLGDVPEEWEVCRVGALYREVSDKGDNELPILTISIHHGASNNELSEDERDRKVVRIDDKSKYKRVQPGDLVYNMMRAWQGGFGAILVKGLVSPAYVVARSKIELSSEYIELQFRTPQAIEAMRRYSHGITDFRLRLYWEKFKTMFVTLPTFSCQTQIMDFIFSETGRIDSLCDKTEKSIELLKEKRQALITATVTGKIDVRNS